MKLIFICGPYRAKTAWQKEQNVRCAEEVAKIVAEHGMFPVCPHSNTRPYFEGIQNDSFWLEGTRKLLSKCDGIILIVGWKHSEGSKAEYELATKLGLEIMELSPNKNIVPYFNIDQYKDDIAHAVMLLNNLIKS